MAIREYKNEEVLIFDPRSGRGFAAFQMEIHAPDDPPPLRHPRQHHFCHTFKGKYDVRNTLLPSERWGLH